MCKGYCQFKDCPITFTVTVKSADDLKAKVEFEGGGCVHNKTELKRRPIWAEDRRTIGQDLQRQLPRAMYLKKLAKINEDLMESGCRDEAPTPQVLKSISWEVRQRSHLLSNDLLSLQIMLEKKKNSPEEVLQEVFSPKVFFCGLLGVLKSFRSDAGRTSFIWMLQGALKKKEKGSPPFYVYELVVRQPTKNCSPLPVATYLTCDHMTASVLYFLEAFQTDVARYYG